MISLFRQHLLALGQALRGIRRWPAGFALNVAVVAIALSLPFAGLTLLENLRPVSQQLSVEPEITVFLRMDTPAQRAAGLATDIRKVAQGASNRARLEFIPRDRALEMLNSRSGLTQVVTALGENPLPDAYVLRLGGVQNRGAASRIQVLAAELKRLPGVEYVQVDSAWVNRLAAVTDVLRIALLFLALTLAVVVIAVTFNTIRLQVLTQRDEIEVSRLFGATDRHIARPFYYTGALLGMCAGGLALGLIAAGLSPLNEAVVELARLYASEFRLAPLGLLPALLLLATSTILGLAGAVLPVKRHLAQLEAR